MTEQLQDGEFWPHTRNKVVNFACLLDSYNESGQMLDQGWRDIEHLRDALNATEQSLSSLMQLTAWYGGYSKWAPDVPNLICYRNLRKSIKILREEHTGLVIHA